MRIFWKKAVIIAAVSGAPPNGDSAPEPPLAFGRWVLCPRPPLCFQYALFLLLQHSLAFKLLSGVGKSYHTFSKDLSKNVSMFLFEQVICSGVTRRRISGVINPRCRFWRCINTPCSKI